jgi:hypothetical protein
MANIRATDALRMLNTEHGCSVSYLKFQRSIVAGVIPAERSDDGRSWLIDENDLDRIAAIVSTAPKRRTRSAA